MLVVSAMLVALTFYSGRAMDREETLRQQALVDNALTSRLQRGLGELRSVAWWDDALLNSSASNLNVEWLDREIGSYMNESYNHDRVMILDEDNRPVYVYGDEISLGSGVLARDLKAAAPVIRQARGGPDVSPRVATSAKPGELYETAKFNGRRYSRGFGAIVSIDGKPALAMASLITPSYDTSGNPPVRRIVMTIIEVTPDVLTEIGREVLMPDLSFAAKTDKRLGSYTLKTDDGKSVLATVHWTPKRPGSEMVKSVLPYILGALIIAGLIMGFLIVRLIGSADRLADREAEAQHLANHDVITGMPNRRNLEAELFRRSSVNYQSGQRLACAVLDLDRFKDINDTLGHSAGDALIRAVGERLKATLCQSDFVARLGGDEFAILRVCSELSDADNLSDTLAACFAEPFPVLGHQIEVGTSIGVALSAMDRAIEDLMREADIALYEAKAKERGSTVRFAPAMASKIEQRRMLEIDLKSAIASRSLTMMYQPIVDAGTGAIDSVEALVRWNSPKHGAVPPDVFVAIAEETGMMADLGRFVIEQVFEDSKRWPQIETAINISPAQLRSASIVQDLMNPARANGVSPAQITLEITESVLMANDLRTLRTLNILKDNGFSLALDDFGTGYSSLAYVRDFPFDKLKIDRSFVTGQDDKKRSVEIIRAVVNFGLILGREVIAEGIETEQEMQAMQAAGVTHLQGYLFSKPVSASHIEALVSTSGRLTAARTTEREAAETSAIDRSLATKVRRIV
jgi:diguanylate cyclase (GGDEF)-like protein